ncbi:Xaa-Pro peptidase family protein [Devosia sp. 2618]|uniref:M24 family metallopeptidase n=1 Tax=Devosia sp. 2618 TaxID=3156454 RepID=UPI0033909AC7
MTATALENMKVMPADPEPFDAGEYATRRQRVRAAMSAAGCDLLVVDSVEDIYYLTGVSLAGTCYQAYLLPLEATPLMVMRELDAGMFLGASLDLGDCVSFGDHEDATGAVLSALGRFNATRLRVGLDLASQALTVRRHAQLTAGLGPIVDCADMVRGVRVVKTEREIGYMRRSAAIVDIAMAQLAQKAQVGMSIRDLVAIAAGSFMENGASCAHVGPVSAGKKSGLHATLDTHVLERGDVVHAELLPEYRGYSARLMRSICLDEPTTAQRAALDMLLKAQDAQFALLRAGNHARDVDAAARDLIDASGLRPNFNGVTGYVLGLYGMPRMSRISDFVRTFTRASEWVIEAGSTFHMYLSAGGIAVSETVLVGASGPERLTTSARTILRAGQ